ncbi:MAG: ankyrin-like [Rickettsiaceae bacterium]|nr:ankyrin-like [Rickettsiaceae bacterium]
MQEQETRQERYKRIFIERERELEQKQVKTLSDQHRLKEIQIIRSLEHITGMQNFIQNINYLFQNNRFDDFGSALHMAIINNDYEVVKLLLDNGIDANHTFFGLYLTILQLACNSSDFNIVKLLLDRGAYINSFNPNRGSTPLSVAISRKNGHEIVKFLLQNGATLDVGSLNIKDDVNLVAYLKEQNNIPLGQEIDFGQIALHPKLYDKYTPALIQALGIYYNDGTEDSNVETVKILISYGENVNDIDHEGKTVLDYAVEKGKRAVTIVLLENGADILNLLSSPEERLHFNGIKETLLSLADILKKSKSKPGTVTLSGNRAPTQLNDKELIISALKGQLIISKDIININNAINFIKEVSPETDIAELLVKVKDIKLSQIEQKITKIIKKGIPEEYNSVKGYFDNIKIDLEEESLLNPETMDFIESVNKDLNDITLNSNSLINIVLRELFDSVLNGKTSVEHLASQIEKSNMKHAVCDSLTKGNLILTQKQIKVKIALEKFWKEEGELDNSNGAEQTDNIIAQEDEADIIETSSILTGDDLNIFEAKE